GAVVDAVRRHIARVLDARNLVVIVRDAEREDLEVVLRLTDGADDAREPRRYPLGDIGLMSVVLATSRPVRTDDYAAECGRHGVEDPQQLQWLRVIERSALDGAQTVRRLQEFTRIRRDQPMVPLDVTQIVRDALDITQSRWREEPVSRGVVIEVRTELAAVPPILGDAAELREALTNLILNAVDAMPTGGTLGFVTTPGGDQVEIAGPDTGVGIPPAVREKIFDPFFTTKGPQGTGLGLSLTYGIVVRHGGFVTVDSEEGRGSTFRLSF